MNYQKSEMIVGSLSVRTIDLNLPLEKTSYVRGDFSFLVSKGLLLDYSNLRVC